VRNQTRLGSSLRSQSLRTQRPTQEKEQAMARTITLAELQAKLDGPNPPVLVEALGPQYYEQAHLPGAINIPHTEVRQLAPSLLPDKDADVVVYCASGPCQNSGIAARMLESLGYTSVSDYHEGKAEWIEAGLPTESGIPVA
jgi:rhodanese-related sulfurtransferase